MGVPAAILPIIGKVRAFAASIGSASAGGGVKEPSIILG